MYIDRTYAYTDDTQSDKYCPMIWGASTTWNDGAGRGGHGAVSSLRSSQREYTRVKNRETTVEKVFPNTDEMNDELSGSKRPILRLSFLNPSYFPLQSIHRVAQCWLCWIINGTFEPTSIISWKRVYWSFRRYACLCRVEERRYLLYALKLNRKIVHTCMLASLLTDMQTTSMILILLITNIL